MLNLNIDKKGNVYIYSGDSGEIVVSGLPTDKNYTVYFMVKDSKNRVVSNVLEVKSNFNSTVTFIITSEFSSKLTIPKNEEVGFYTYGIKTVDDDGIENTLFVEDCCYEDSNMILVFPDKVEV